MISEAIVDCYNENEQATGLFTMVEENLRLPFSTTVLGIQVNVQKVELNDAGEIVAVCSRGPEKQRIPLEPIPIPMASRTLTTQPSRICSCHGIILSFHQ